MKFKISMPAMKYAAKLSASFAADSKELAELRCLKIRASVWPDIGPKLTITAFNRTAWVHLDVAGAEISEAGVALIDAESFRRWVGAGSDAHPLEVSVVGANATLTNGKATCKLPTLDVEKYTDPTYSASAGHTLATLPAKDLVSGIGCVAMAMDRKEGAQKLRSDVVYFDIAADGLHLVAADGKVLSEMHLGAVVVGDPISQSVPFASASLLVPLLESAGEDEVTVKVSARECLIETGRFKFGTRLIDAKQFPWRLMFSKFAQTPQDKIKLPVKEMISAIRQVMAADPTQYRLGLAFEMGSLTVDISDKAEAVVDLPDNAVDMRFHCQPEFLLDVLNVVARRDLPLTVEWGMNQPTVRIALFRAGTGWRYTITPLVDPALERK